MFGCGKGFNRDGAKCWEYVLVYSDDLLVGCEES